jgi:hypothetical protein
MTDTWSRERVLALAPDSASVQAATRLAMPAVWSGTGTRGALLWGSCAGSGRVPYSTLVHLDGPGYKCTCPSRKHPCKHALALMLLRSTGLVPDGQPPDAAADWLASRQARAAQAASRQPGELADPEAAARRAEQRAERVRLGLDELDLWLADQVRGGLAQLQRAGYGPVDQVAARMVDAQAPGVAAMVRRLPSRFVGEAWPAATLEHLALIRLLVVAHRRLQDLPDDLAATVRSRVGYPVSKSSVLATTPVRDRWTALGMVDEPDDRLVTRRVWLRGATSGRWALLLAYAVPGGSFDSTVVAGETLDADLHFYPGAAPQRAVLGVEHAREETVPDLAGTGVAEGAAAYAAQLAADPWSDRVPVLLEGAPIPPRDEEGVGRWWFRGTDGLAVPMRRGAQAWPLLARSMGDPVRVFGEWSGAGFWPLGVLPHPLSPRFSTEVLAA